MATKMIAQKDMLKDFFVCFGVFLRIMTSTYLLFQMRGSVHTHRHENTRFLRGDFLRLRSSNQNMKEVHLVAVDLSETHSFQGSKCWNRPVENHQMMQQFVNENVVYKDSQRRALFAIYNLALDCDYKHGSLST